MLLDLPKGIFGASSPWRRRPPAVLTQPRMVSGPLAQVHVVMFAQEKAYAASQRDLKAHVFFAIGAVDAVKRGNKLYNQQTERVKDWRNFDAALT